MSWQAPAGQWTHCKVCCKTSLSRDKNVVITWIQLKLWLVLTGIFQLIITETEPSLLCCFVPSSESNQETAQPHTLDGAAPSMSWVSCRGPIHGMPGFLMNTTKKSSADSVRIPREGENQAFPGPAQAAQTWGRGNKNHCREKTPVAG